MISWCPLLVLSMSTRSNTTKCMYKGLLHSLSLVCWGPGACGGDMNVIASGSGLTSCRCTAYGAVRVPAAEADKQVSQAGLHQQLALSQHHMHRKDTLSRHCSSIASRGLSQTKPL